MTTEPSTIMTAAVTAVAAAELLRKHINALPTPPGIYMGRILKPMDKGCDKRLSTPCRMAGQGYRIVLSHFEDGVVLIQVVEIVGQLESGQCETTLQQLGLTSFKKLIHSFARGLVYRKNGALYHTLVNKQKEIYGAVPLLTPMSEEHRFKASCMIAF